MQNFTRQCKVPEKGRVTVSNFGAKVINFGAYPGEKGVKRQDAKGTRNERKWFLRFLFGKKTFYHGVHGGNTPKQLRCAGLRKEHRAGG